MKTKLKRALLVIVGVFGCSVCALLVYKPVDEWTGLSVRSFDPAGMNLPADATKILMYETGFTDGRTWLVFSASRESLGDFLEKKVGRQIADLKICPPEKRAAPIPLSRWRSKGYWDFEPKESMRYFYREEGRLRVEIFIDVEKWRLYSTTFG